jgi:signal transduction histidine kinase
MQDLSDRTALAVSNSTFHQETRSALRLRDDFIRLAAHELRTPLTSLSLQVEVLDRKLQSSNLPDSESLIRLLTKVSESSLRLKELVQEMLEMAGLANGTVSLSPARINLSLLVKEVVEQFRFPEEATNCALRIEESPQIIGNWDRIRIQEAIRYLLRSAVIFCKGRTVRINVSRESEHARLALRVGSVLPEEEKPRNLEEVDRLTAVEQLGLGVYVVNEIVEAHGGRFRIYGFPGTEFEYLVELPLGEARARAAA